MSFLFIKLLVFCWPIQQYLYPSSPCSTFLHSAFRHFTFRKFDNLLYNISTFFILQILHLPQFTGWVMKTFGSTRWLKNLKLSNLKIRKRKSPPRPQFRLGWGQNSLHFWREVQTRIQPSLLRPQVAAMMFMFCLPIRIPRHKGIAVIMIR